MQVACKQPLLTLRPGRIVLPLRASSLWRIFSSKYLLLCSSKFITSFGATTMPFARTELAWALDSSPNRHLP